MITTIRSQFRLLKHTLYRWRTDPKLNMVMRVLFFLASGFLLSASSLAHHAQPLVLGLVCALSGVPAGLAALGGALGYVLFWGSAGSQGILWAGLGLCCSLAAGFSQSRHGLLMPALAGLICALSGLLTQRLGDTTAPAIYLLRIALAMGSTHLFAVVQQRRDSVAQWLVYALAVLALAQVVPFPWLCLGYGAAAAATVAGPFPLAVLTGLALDLGGVTTLPMSAVFAIAWLVRLLPVRRWMTALSPVLCYPLIGLLYGNWSWQHLPALAVGGLLALALPGGVRPTPRRGEVGVAQVRLELAASVLEQLQQLLAELPPPQVDAQALVDKACQQACGSCSARKNCPGRVHARALTADILKLPLGDSSLPFSCRRSGRLLAELRRSQEQLRLLHAGQQRQSEYRAALLRQYRFLALFLQELSDRLSLRIQQTQPHYRAEVTFCGNRHLEDNGDRCLSFAGTGCQYYVLLCDGMGTGLGAVDESRSAATLLKQLLCAGFPAEHALSTLNSLFALGDRAGAATVDLAQLNLDTGRVVMYKWGAAPSWLLTERGSEKIGTAGPPPGLSVSNDPETALRLSLRRGEVLAMVSDGVGGEAALRSLTVDGKEPLSALAERILKSRILPGGDDATVALIRLDPTA